MSDPPAPTADECFATKATLRPSSEQTATSDEEQSSRLLSAGGGFAKRDSRLYGSACLHPWSSWQHRGNTRCSICVRCVPESSLFGRFGRSCTYLAAVYELRALWALRPVVVRVHSRAWEQSCLAGLFYVLGPSHRRSYLVFGLLPLTNPNTFPNILGRSEQATVTDQR
jgi:hypothetical protein